MEDELYGKIVLVSSNLDFYPGAIMNRNKKRRT
jgi:hypothetical protein